MKKINTVRFAIMQKGGHLVKPFLDDTPCLLFKTKSAAQAVMVMDKQSTYQIVKVKVVIEPTGGWM